MGKGDKMKEQMDIVKIYTVDGLWKELAIANVSHIKVNGKMVYPYHNINS